MVIGNFLGYSSLGLGSAPLRTLIPGERAALTLDAQPDPKTPNEYSVAARPPLIPPPEKASENAAASKRAPRNSDPVSRAFNAVADYETRVSRIDIYV